LELPKVDAERHLIALMEQTEIWVKQRQAAEDSSEGASEAVELSEEERTEAKDFLRQDWDSGRLWVEFRPLAEALGLTITGDEQQMVGAKVIVNKSMGTVDVSLVPPSTATRTPTGISSVGSAAYTLIEYGVPGQAITERMKPVFASVRSEFKNVDYQGFCNAWNDGNLKRYSKFTQSMDATCHIPRSNPRNFSGVKIAIHTTKNSSPQAGGVTPITWQTAA